MQSGAGLGNLLLLALPLLLLGYLMWSQRRRSRDIHAMQAALAVGDEIITSGGVLGRIVALDDEVATVEIAPDVRVRVARRALTKPMHPPGAPRPDSAQER